MKVLWNVEHLFGLLVLNIAEDSAPKCKMLRVPMEKIRKDVIRYAFCNGGQSSQQQALKTHP